MIGPDPITRELEERRRTAALAGKQDLAADLNNQIIERANSLHRGEQLTYLTIDAINAYRATRSSNPSSINLALADAQAISDYHWWQQDPSVRPAKLPVLKVGDTAQLWGVALTVSAREPGIAVLDGMRFHLTVQQTVKTEPVAPLYPGDRGCPEQIVSQASIVNEERRATRHVGNPPTSNMSSHTLAKLLLANPDGPVLVLFDNQCGCASELYVLTHLSDAPDWADPNTVYIDAHGG